MRSLADSSLENHAAVYNKHFFKQHKKIKWNDDIEIKYLTLWLRQNVEHKNTKIKLKTISVSELEKLLRTKNLTTSFSGKYLTIAKKTSVLQDLFGRKGYSKDYIIKDEKNVSLSLVEQMRKDFSISFLDGVDNSTFYNDEDIINNEIVSYKKIIYKLAKT